MPFEPKKTDELYEAKKDCKLSTIAVHGSAITTAILAAASLLYLGTGAAFPLGISAVTSLIVFVVSAIDGVAKKAFLREIIEERNITTAQPES